MSTTEDKVTIAKAVIDAASLVMDGEPHELRIIDKDRRVASGVFATPEELSAAALDYDGRANVYIGLNPTSLAPYPLRQGAAVKDQDVSRIRWLGIDVDGADAIDVALEIDEYLRGRGWGMPVLAGSGVGYWLLYRIDQENTWENAGLRRLVLVGLKTLWPAVDVSVHNASRVCRLFGTRNIKDGAARSEIIFTDAFQVVTDDQLKEVADLTTLRQGRVPHQPDVILDALSGQLGITPTKRKVLSNGGELFELSDCPFVPGEDHTTAAFLMTYEDRGVAFRCHGGRCQEPRKGIRELLELLHIETAILREDDGFRVVMMDTISPEAVETCWDGRLVLHHLNLIVGEEGIGKGVLGARLIANITTGWAEAGLLRPALVGMSSTEDRPAVDIRPRLSVAGADLSKVASFEMGGLKLPEGSEQLARVIRSLNLEWLWLDPLHAHFSAGHDVNRAQSVNLVLSELVRVAQDTGCTIVATLHTNRSASLDPRMRLAHQIEFNRVSRSAILIGKADENEEAERTIIHFKHNYTVEAPALRVMFESADIEIDGKLVSYPVITLDGPLDVTAEDLFLKGVDTDGAVRAARQRRTKTDDCVEAIIEHHKKLDSRALLQASFFNEALEKFGGNVRQAARERLGIVATKAGGGDGSPPYWVWEFPPTMTGEEPKSSNPAP